MIIDARELQDDDVLEVDLCIIGAGPAGIALGLELEATGAKVALLESGGRGWGTRGKGLTRGENVDPYYPRLEWTRLRMFGGSSWAWRKHSLRTRPLEALDFVERPEIERGGWPFPGDALSPYWWRATDLCRLPSRGYGVADWEDPVARPVRGAADLDTAMFPLGPGDAFTGRFEEVRRLANVTCFLNATALELVTDETGRQVEHVVVAAGSGRSFRVRSRRFVLALGGIENARLLLLSRRGRRTALGNDHDHVGRYFMEHPHVRSGALRLRADPSPAGLKLYERVTRPEGAAIGFLRLSDEALRRERLLASAWALHPSTPAMNSEIGRDLSDLKATVRAHVRVLPGTGARLRRVALHPVHAANVLLGSRHVRRGREPAREYRLLGMMEQEPNRDSRVMLGDRRDRFGQPVARLEWRLSERDVRGIRRTQDVLSDALARAGIGHIVDRFGDSQPPPLPGPGFHHMGTTRMSLSAREGVVDTDCRVHGTTNLYVAGSSVFPTSGFANPTLPLLAVTLRLAEHLRASLEGR
jgi:choline dehydrogenase-like flavoprotein